VKLNQELSAIDFYKNLQFDMKFKLEINVAAMNGLMLAVRVFIVGC
jgi:hypothetical protein